MKYLPLLFLISCASIQKPNCSVKETGVILDRQFSILECNNKPIAYTKDYGRFTECSKNRAENGKIICIRRD